MLLQDNHSVTRQCKEVLCEPGSAYEPKSILQLVLTKAVDVIQISLLRTSYNCRVKQTHSLKGRDTHFLGVFFERQFVDSKCSINTDHALVRLCKWEDCLHLETSS